MIKKLSMKRAIFAGTAIATGIAFAGISDDFESASAWEGGSLKTLETALTSVPAGFPISGDGITHNKVLCIDGEASRSNSGSANAKAQLNFLAFITEPSDELPAASSSEMTGVQIAFAAGTTSDNGYNVENSTVALMLYCKAKAGTGDAGWQNTGATLAMNEWHHIQLLFDYNNKVCQVCVDGVPTVSSIGRLTPTDTDTMKNGSWYVLANDPASTTSYVSGLTMYGTAQVDDVVVQEGSNNKFTGDSGAKIGSTALSYETLAKFGVDESTITTAKLGSSGLTVAQCLQCGLEPTGSDKFKVTSATQTAADTLQLVFPGSASAKNGIKPQYQIQWEYVDGNGVTQTPSTNLVDDNLAGGNDGTVTATVAVPNDIKNQKVLKYRLKAVAPSAQ